MLHDVKWTERIIQDALYPWMSFQRRHELIVPNSCVFGWEADMIGVTRSDMIHEFEIKVTKADFKADAKKDRAGILEVGTVTSWGRTRPAVRPNYFWYVVPIGLITTDDIAPWMGLIYAEPLHHMSQDLASVRVIREAKKIHTEKMSLKQFRQLTRATTERYWRQRRQAARKSRAALDRNPEISNIVDANRSCGVVTRDLTSNDTQAPAATPEIDSHSSSG